MEMDNDGRRRNWRPIMAMAAIAIIFACGAVAYYVQTTFSNEVWARKTTSAIGWAWWMLPSGLAALLVFVLVIRAVGYRRMSLLQKSLAGSILVHILVLVILGLVPISQAVVQYVARQAGQSPKIDLDVGREAELSLQIRGQSSDMPIAGPSAHDRQDSPPPLAPATIVEPGVRQLRPQTIEVVMDPTTARPVNQDRAESLSVAPPEVMTAKPDVSVHQVAPLRQDEPQPQTPSAPLSLRAIAMQPTVQIARPNTNSAAAAPAAPDIKPMIDISQTSAARLPQMAVEKVNPVVAIDTPAVIVKTQGPDVRLPASGQPAKAQEQALLPGPLDQVGAVQHRAASSGLPDVPAIAPKLPHDVATTMPAVASLAGVQIIARRPASNEVGREALTAPSEPGISSFMPARLTGPDSLFQRSAQQRQKLIADMGGTKESEAAVSRSLGFLAQQQDDDGHWSGEGKGSTRGRHDVAITGLGTLCFLAGDHTPTREGPYQEKVKKAVDFLLSKQKADGDLRGGGDMYDHAIATLTVAEAAVMTQQDKYILAAKKAADFIVKAQNRQTGGWRYAPQDAGDTSVLGWQVMALHSAAQLGYEVPKETKDSALRWLNSVSPGNKLLAGYQGPPLTPTMTAEAVFSRILLGQQLTSDQLEDVSKYLMSNPPQSTPGEGKSEYYWYYATMAMMHMRSSSWPQWNEKMRDLLVKSQKHDGKLDGSWDADTKYGPHGGRIYTTSMATLTLEVYYRYLPMYKSGEQSKP